MALPYPLWLPQHLRYTYCPQCAHQLVEKWDHDGLFRPTCSTCGWIYYPPNVLGVSILVTTPEGIVCLLPPGEPEDAPAALPGGCVECGEPLEEAARREAREETGLEVEIVRELTRGFERDFPYGPMFSFSFEARMVGGALRDSPEGHVAIYPLTALPTISPLRPGSRRTLAAYLASLQLPDLKK